MWPVIAPVCGGGELVPVEGVTTDRMAVNFDVLAGIDAWQTLTREGAMRGIASRVQYLQPDQRPWNTYTIRWLRFNGASTEFEKRMRAISQPERGFLYPALTVQAYVWDHDETLASWAVITTRGLFLALRCIVTTHSHNMPPYRKETGFGCRSTTNAKFIAVSWPYLAARGFQIAQSSAARPFSRSRT